MKNGYGFGEIFKNAILFVYSKLFYKGARLIRRVLYSLEACCFENLDIYMVDNDSSDNTLLIVENEFSKINIIKSQKNIGYGAGRNLVIKQIESDYHIVVNPDISVEKSEIEKMVTYMEVNKETVILTPKVLNTDGTEQYLRRFSDEI